MQQAELPHITCMGWGDRALATGHHGQGRVRRISAPRFGRAWFLRVQLDWIEQQRSAILLRLVELRTTSMQLKKRVHLARRFRSLAKETPVTRRDLQERDWITGYHVHRAMLRKMQRRLRKMQRRLRDLVRKL